jgi:hypothetical protein
MAYYDHYPEAPPTPKQSTDIDIRGVEEATKHLINGLRIINAYPECRPDLSILLEEIHRNLKSIEAELEKVHYKEYPGLIQRHWIINARGELVEVRGPRPNATPTIEED